MNRERNARQYSHVTAILYHVSRPLEGSPGQIKVNCSLSYYIIAFLVIFSRFSEEECDEMFHFANADDDGNFNYLEFTKTIKHGDKDE